MKGLAVALLALATRAAAEVTVEAKPQITYFTTLAGTTVTTRGNQGTHLADGAPQPRVGPESGTPDNIDARELPRSADSRRYAISPRRRSATK